MRRLKTKHKTLERDLSLEIILKTSNCRAIVKTQSALSQNPFQIANTELGQHSVDVNLLLKFFEKKAFCNLITALNWHCPVSIRRTSVHSIKEYFR